VTVGEHVVCLVTAPTAMAREIAAGVVESGLAACVNIVPTVESIYRWEGRVEREEESLLVVKSTRAALEALNAAVRAVHPYENFELVALDVAGGSPAYLRWISESVRPANP
jgi:periplasmic divalent cation tolerance protein